MTLTYGKTEEFCPDCSSVQMSRVLELKGWSAVLLRCMTCQTEYGPQASDQGKHTDRDLDHTPDEAVGE